MSDLSIAMRILLALNLTTYFYTVWKRVDPSPYLYIIPIQTSIHISIDRAKFKSNINIILDFFYVYGNCEPHTCIYDEW